MPTPLRPFVASAVLLIVAFAGVPAKAHAGGLISGFVGTHWGDSVGTDRPVTWGGSIGTTGAIGFEIEFGRTQDFFQTEDTTGQRTSVTTLMGNVVFGGAGIGIKPYVSAGAGLLRFNVEEASDVFDDLSRNDFGVNAGGGVMVTLAPSFAVRGDVRYFRSLRGADEDEDLVGTGFGLSDFSYWRGSLGIVLRF